MGIETSNLCEFCRTEIDSVEHILLHCDVSKGLWAEVNKWIVELGMNGYHLPERRIIIRKRIDNKHYHTVNKEANI